MNKKGFTLVEIVMAMVIGGIIIYSLLGVFTSLTTRSPILDSLDIALSLANAKLETVSNMKFSRITSEAQTSFGGEFSDFNSQVIVRNVASGELEVSVGPATGYKWIKVIITSNNLPGGSIEATTLATDISND